MHPDIGYGEYTGHHSDYWEPHSPKYPFNNLSLLGEFKFEASRFVPGPFEASQGDKLVLGAMAREDGMLVASDELFNYQFTG